MAAATRLARSALWLVPAAVFIVASASADLVAATGHDPFGVWAILPAGPPSGSWVTVEVSSTIFFLIGLALVRRKPLGLRLALVVLLAGAVVHGIWLAQPRAAAVALATATILVAARRRFTVSSRSVDSAAAGALVVVAIVIVAGGWASLVASGAQLASTDAALPLVQWFDLGGSTADGPPTIVAGALLAHLAIIVALVLALTPAEDPLPAVDSLDSDAAMRQYGSGSLLPYQLEAPCRAFMVPGLRAALSYARAGRAAVVLGDPAGEPDAAGRTFEAWATAAEAGDWIPVVYQGTESFATRLAVAGWHPIRIGADAIVDPRSFDLRSPRLANVRHTVSRNRKGNVAITLTPERSTGLPPGVTAGDLGELDRALGRHAGPRLGFTVGSLDPRRLDDARVAVARTGDEGPLLACVALRPTGADGGWMVDVMCRRPGGVPGSVEACLVAAIEELGRKGVSRISLGLAPLAGLDMRTGSIEERLLAGAARAVRPLYDTAGLAFFKDKFNPRWEPRYLIVRHRWHLASAAIGLLRLHITGLGFSVPWRQGKRVLEGPSSGGRPGTYL